VCIGVVAPAVTVRMWPGSRRLVERGVKVVQFEGERAFGRFEGQLGMEGRLLRHLGVGLAQD
jgi:hypothetical protein